jgi:hypothetical protein
VLDLSQPVAVMALMVLQYVPDEADPGQIVGRLMDALPAGSYLTISDTTRDIDTDRVTAGTNRLNTRMGPTQLTLRTRDQIAGFFGGLDFVGPGLVPLAQWHADPDPAHAIPAFAGMARKP